MEIGSLDSVSGGGVGRGFCPGVWVEEPEYIVVSVDFG